MIKKIKQSKNNNSNDHLHIADQRQPLGAGAGFFLKKTFFLTNIFLFVHDIRLLKFNIVAFKI